MVLSIMFDFLPAKDETDILYRWQLATAIVNGTEDPTEQRILTHIAWYESKYWRSVASCKKLGDNGKSRGVYQIQGRDENERKEACGTLNQQTALALKFIRKSREMCAHLPAEDQLSLYTTGKCQNNRESQLRYNRGVKLSFMIAK